MLCPTCKIKCQTTDVSFESDGLVRVDGICINCKQGVQLELPYATIVTVCECQNEESDPMNWVYEPFQGRLC